MDGEVTVQVCTALYVTYLLHDARYLGQQWSVKGTVCASACWIEPL